MLTMQKNTKESDCLLILFSNTLFGEEHVVKLVLFSLSIAEVVENNKEGYESDVASDDLSDKGYNSSDDER